MATHREKKPRRAGISLMPAATAGLLAAVGMSLCSAAVPPRPPTAEWKWLEAQPEGAFKLRVQVSIGAGADQDATAWIAFNRTPSGRGYLLALSRRGARFARLERGRLVPVRASTHPIDLRPGSPVAVTLKRGLWEMVAIVGDQVAARAFDATWHGGRLGLAVSGPGMTFAEPRVQPLAKLYFADDFMRAPGETGDWTSLAGTWRVGSPREGTRADPRLSANPFFYRVKAFSQGFGLAAAGHWFWDDYSLSVAVRMPSTGAAGICAFVQDRSRYVVFRVRFGTNAPTAELMEVSPAGERLLADKPVSCRPGQWYKLTLIATADALTGQIDSRTVCRSTTVPFGQGRVGLYAGGQSPSPQLRFDDVRVVTVGRSALHDLGAVSWDEVAVKGITGAPPIRLTGAADWETTRVSVQAKVSPLLDAGLCFGYRSPDDYYLIRRHVNAWTGRTVWELWKAAPTGITCVARYELSPAAAKNETDTGWVSVSGEFLGGAVRAQVGDYVVLTAVDADLLRGVRPAGGRVGVLADDSPASRYRDLTLTFPGPDPPPLEVTPQFTKEDTMAGWASPRGVWTLGKHGWIWRRDEFFRDCLFSFPLPDEKKPGHVDVILAGDGTDPRHGYRLALDIQVGKPLACRLLRDEKPVASRTGIEWEPGDHIRFQRTDDLVLVDLTGGPLLAYRDPSPLSGRKVGFRTQGIETDVAELKKPRYGTTPQTTKRKPGAGDQVLNTVGSILLGRVLHKNAPDLARVIDRFGVRVNFVKILSRKQRQKERLRKAADPKLELNELTARSSHLYDCSFSTAPVDWRVGDGVWQVTQRWTCSPQWTFFGGRGGKHPTLWSKRSFFGDQVVEFFAAKPMAQHGPGHDRPSNFSLTMCGDGNDPAVGYVFTVAADGGRWNRLTRNGRVLTESPYKLTSNNPHRAWFQIRAERIGDTLTLTVDDLAAFSVSDSDPLPGGFLAFSSDPQGMMIARVKVWDSGPPAPKP